MLVEIWENELSSPACEAQLREDLCRAFCVGEQGMTAYEAKAILPAFLSPVVWARHNFSVSDIKTTLAAFPTGQLWQLLASEQVALGKSQSCSSMREKLVAHVEHMFPPDGSVLRKTRRLHHPILPCHRVDRTIWRHLTSAQQGLVRVANTDCYFLPLNINEEKDDCILMGRVVPLEAFENVYGLSCSPALVLRVQDRTLAVLEETCLLRPD